MVVGPTLAEGLGGSTKESRVQQRGALLNPYLPNVSCNYDKQKLWFNGSAWACVDDRTKKQ